MLRPCRELGRKKFRNGYGRAYERTDEEGRSVKVTRHSCPNFRREGTPAGSPQRTRSPGFQAGSKKADTTLEGSPPPNLNHRTHRLRL